MSIINRNNPCLRWPLEIRLERFGSVKGTPTNTDEALLIRCPLGISEQPLLLVPAVAPIIARLDGTRSIQQILDEFAPYGIRLELINELLAMLDRHLFLQSPHFEQESARINAEFSRSPLRLPALAGLSYPATQAELTELIDGYLTLAPITQIPESRPAVLISPHIDYLRGGSCYGKAYPALRNSNADIFIVIGTAHHYSKEMFHLTKKRFLTPLGAIESNEVFINQLVTNSGSSLLFKNELLHKKEHSLELQLPFLQRSVNREFTMVPILVGSFHEMISSQREPTNFDEYENFASALTESIRTADTNGMKVCIIAGVDMAHVGQQFGDTGKLSTQFMQDVAERDSIYLAAIEALDKRTLFQHIAEDNDARRICGFPTMYLVVDVLTRLKRKLKYRLFDYSQAVNYDTECAVTFAGAGLFEVG